MEVRYKKVLKGEACLSFDKPDEVYEFKHLLDAGAERVFCCEKMEEAWERRFIGFGEYDCYLNRNSDVNVYKCHPYPEGACWDEMAIKQCPFCGEEIKTIEAEVASLKRVKKVRPKRTEEELVEEPYVK